MRTAGVATRGMTGLDRWSRRLLAALLLPALLMTAPVGRQGDTPAAGAARSLSVIVRSLQPGAAGEAVVRHGGRVTADLSIVNGVAATVPADAVPAIAAEPGVRVENNGRVRVQASTPPRDATGVYSRAVGADQAWTAGVDGSGVSVGVIDTGIAPVADLAGRVVAGVDLSGEKDALNDGFGHGTFVAGVIAGDGASSGGAYRGVAPGARLVSIKVAGPDGASDVAHVLAGLQWAVSFKDAYNIRVLNLSLGTDSTQPYQHSLLDYAVERAWDHGIVVVVSASNLGPDAGTVTKPGDDPLVVTAGAADDKGTTAQADDDVADFSGRGPTKADGLAKPDLVAPGTSLVSLRNPGSTIDAAFPGSRVDTAYFKGSGTSFAAGVVSGAAALLIDAHPNLTPDQVKARLMGTADPSPAMANPFAAGRGELDVPGALASSATGSQASVPRSLGDGTIQADAGSVPMTPDVNKKGLGRQPVKLDVQDAKAAGISNDDLRKLRKGESVFAFDGHEYVTSSWDASQWYASQWYSSGWQASQWYASQWYASQWYASQWYASQWYASQWYASQWYASQWYASQWYASQWYASQWYASQWFASSWS